MKCPRCGNRLSSGNRFCNKCGTRTGDQPANNTGKGFAHTANPRKNKAVWIVGITVALLSLAAVIVLLLVPAPDKQDSAAGNSLITGTSIKVADAQIGTEGGIISADEGEYSGFSIQVLKDAFGETVTFDISAAPVTSHGFGEIFNAASPLYTIENGGTFADTPMIVTIPIEKEDDETAMAFFYNEETGWLQSLPLLSVTNDELVTMTQHFSGVVVSKIKKDKIDTVYDTKFKPGVHDFQIANYGSYIEPEGFCAGQCIAMAYYHVIDELNQGKTLYGRFDNDGVNKTPGFWYDDADAIRLCSCIQKDMGKIWDDPSDLLEEMQDKQGVNDTETYYAILYAMMVSKEPQIICVSGGSKGNEEWHAVLAYKVTSDAVFIADPNCPGDATRKIPVVKDANGKFKFGTYISGKDKYDKVGYFGLYSMMNEKTTYALWREVIDGSPTHKYSAADYFPDDIVIEVAVGKDDKGQYITKPLTDGFLLTKAAVAKLGLSNGKNLMCRILNAKDKAKAWVMMDTGYLGETDGSFHAFLIASGVNRIGIYHMIDEKYVNFLWYDVIYEDIQPMMTASPEQANTGEKISFQIDLEGNAYVYKWDFGDGNKASTNGAASTKHAYTKEGTYTVSAGIYNKAGDYLGKSETSVGVTGPETTPDPTQQATATPAPTEDYSDIYGTWKNTSEIKYNVPTNQIWYWVETLEINSDGTVFYEFSPVVRDVAEDERPEYESMTNNIYEYGASGGTLRIFKEGESASDAFGYLFFDDDVYNDNLYRDGDTLIYSSSIFKKAG